MSGFGNRFDEAFEMAHRLHRTELRKQGPGSDLEIPYIGHLMGVSALVIDDGGDEDEAIAALLHDAAEDVGGASVLVEIEEKFGPRVRELVEGLSDTLEPDDKPEWKSRKEDYLRHLEVNRDKGLLRISLADKLYNARSILVDHGRVGDRVWDRFKPDRAGTCWYYSELARIFSTKELGAMADEFNDAVRRLNGL